MSPVVGRDRTQLRRERRPSRLRAAFEETLMENLSAALEGSGRREDIVVGYRRKLADIKSDEEKLNRTAERERADIDKEEALTDNVLRSENRGLELLKQRRNRLLQAKEPTEVVEGQIVDAERHILQVQEQKNKYVEHRHRYEQDLARALAEKAKERQEADEDARRELRRVGG